MYKKNTCTFTVICTATVIPKYQPIEYEVTAVTTIRNRLRNFILDDEKRNNDMSRIKIIVKTKSNVIRVWNIGYDEDERESNEIRGKIKQSKKYF